MLRALCAVAGLLLVSSVARLEEPKLVQVPPATDEIQKDSTGTKAHANNDSQLAVTLASKGETATTDVDDGTDDPKQNKHHTDWALFWATIGLAVVTVGLDVLVLLQLRQARHTDNIRSKQMDDTLAQMRADTSMRDRLERAGLRSYVYLAPEIKQSSWPSDGDTHLEPWYQFVFSVRNYGNTPALDVVVDSLADCCALVHDMPAAYTRSVDIGELAPGETSHSIYEDCDIVTEWEDDEATSSPDEAFDVPSLARLCGELSYTDIFGERRVLTFCRLWYRLDEEKQPVTNPSSTRCEIHQDRTVKTVTKEITTAITVT